MDMRGSNDSRKEKGIREFSRELLKELTLREIEIEASNSKYYRETYINRELIFSNTYVSAIKLMERNRYCSSSIIKAARAMLTHHHGDKYEDLYFIDPDKGKTVSVTNYTVREQEVLPTKEMKLFAVEHAPVISVHNHPGNSLPSMHDIFSCYEHNYKYGVIACHNGTIYQYSTTGFPLRALIMQAENIYYSTLQELRERSKLENLSTGSRQKFTNDINQSLPDGISYGILSASNFQILQQRAFVTLQQSLLDANVVLNEVLKND